MPMYLFQGKFSPGAFKALIAKPQDRTEAARRVVEAAGGKLHHYFYAFGEYDVVALLEFPDNTACTSAMMAVAAGGALSGGQTTVLVTTAEGKKAMAKAKAASKAYAPPTKG
jgi:uncharacterized protein with GYD domain